MSEGKAFFSALSTRTGWEGAAAEAADAEAAEEPAGDAVAAEGDDDAPPLHPASPPTMAGTTNSPDATRQRPLAMLSP